MDDLISRAAIEWHNFLVADGNGMYHEEKVAYKSQIDTLPSTQPEPCDDPRADVYYLAEKIGIHRLYALVVELRGEPELCEDAVSREAAIKCCTFGRTSLGLIDELRRLPSVQPERKRGKWVYYPKASGSVTSTAVHLYPVCSECGCEHPSTNYCPNCGAQMEEGEADGKEET